MAGSYDSGYVKRTANAGETSLTAFVPVAAKSKFLGWVTIHPGPDEWSLVVHWDLLLNLGSSRIVERRYFHHED